MTTVVVVVVVPTDVPRGLAPNGCARGAAVKTMRGPRTLPGDGGDAGRRHSGCFALAFGVLLLLLLLGRVEPGQGNLLEILGGIFAIKRCGEAVEGGAALVCWLGQGYFLI